MVRYNGKEGVKPIAPAFFMVERMLPVLCSLVHRSSIAWLFILPSEPKNTQILPPFQPMRRQK